MTPDGFSSTTFPLNFPSLAGSKPLESQDMTKTWPDMSIISKYSA